MPLLQQEKNRTVPTSRTRGTGDESDEDQERQHEKTNNSPGPSGSDSGSSVSPQSIAVKEPAPFNKEAEYEPYGTVKPTQGTASKGDGDARVPIRGEDDDDGREDGGAKGRGKGILRAGGLVSSAVNLASTALGAGVLGIPWSMARSGILISILFTIFCLGGAVYSIWVLLRLVDKVGVPSYEGLAMKLYGRWGKLVTSLSLFLQTFVSTILYIKVVGSILVPIHEEMVKNSDFPEGEWGIRLFQFIIWVGLMMPLTLLKTINALRYPSLIGVSSIFILITAVFIHLIKYRSSAQVDENAIVATTPSWDWIQSLNNIKFAFGAQPTAFPVYAELRPHNLGYMTEATFVGMIGCAIVYLVTGLLGLLTFGAGIPDNLLNAFIDPMSEWYLVVAYICFCFTIVVSFPIMMMPSRDAVIHWLFGYKLVGDCPTWKRILLSLLLATSSFIIGIFVPSLNLLFGILGGVCANLTSFILPAAFALKVGWKREDVGIIHVIGVWGLLIAGVVLGPLGTAVSIYLEVR